MSRHAGHETNSARPRVSSPSRRRRASPGTTSDAVANRTIKAKTPRRYVNTISGGEAPRGVMTEGRGRSRWVPFRRRRPRREEKFGSRRRAVSDFKRASHDGRDGELEGVRRLVGGRRRGLRRGVRASPRPRHVRARRGARRGVDGGAPSPLQRIFHPQPHPSIANNDDSPLHPRPPAAPPRTSSRPSTSRACAKPSTARTPPTSPRTTATNPGPGSTTPSPPSCR